METSAPASDHPVTAPVPDTVAAFAADLRAVRLRAGNPTLVALAALTGISKSVLSDAMAGRRLPTEKTTILLAEALAEDPAEWVRRRTRLLTGQTAEPRGPSAASVGARTVSMRRLLVSVGATAVLCVSVTSAAWATMLLPMATTAAAAPSPSASEYLPYTDGVDPMQTICREDAVIAASEQRLDGAVQVQMMYSKTCMAAWGRVTRYDGDANGEQLSMRIYPAIDVESSRSQERSAFDLQSLYTPMMIEPDVEARVCGLASMTKDGQTIELGPPECI